MEIRLEFCEKTKALKSTSRHDISHVIHEKNK